MLLEVACFNLRDALMAQQYGADRIEFCEDYSRGGITPSKESIRLLLKERKIPLYVMVRPRGGNFVYSPGEVSEMKEQILFCKEAGCDGVVFGVLTADNKLNKRTNMELVQLAAPMSCTFHRAFDKVADSKHALEDCIECGFERVLCSGGNGGAHDNIDALKNLQISAGNRIIIMPGGGVRSINALEILRLTGCNEIHTAAMDTNTMHLDADELKRIKTVLSV